MKTNDGKDHDWLVRRLGFGDRKIHIPRSREVSHGEDIRGIGNVLVIKKSSFGIRNTFRHCLIKSERADGELSGSFDPETDNMLGCA